MCDKVGGEQAGLQRRLRGAEAEAEKQRATHSPHVLAQAQARKGPMDYDAALCAWLSLGRTSSILSQRPSRPRWSRPSVTLPVFLAAWRRHCSPRWSK